MIGIYKITNPKGKIYVGQSINIIKRWKSYNNLECKCQTILYRSFSKYGIKNHKFEIICECFIEELNDKERYYQDLFSCLGKNGLNCLLTKSSDRSGEVSDITKKNISIANKGKKVSIESVAKRAITMIRVRKEFPFKTGPKKGYKFSEERKIAISKNMIGRRLSDETKRKISNSHIGKKLSKDHKAKINPKGRIHSYETIIKMRNSQKGKIVPLDHLKRMTEICSTLVINIETGIFYSSIAEASIYHNMKRTTLSKKLDGTLKTNETSLRYA